MIQFTCPFCHQAEEYPDSRIGQLETCPTCGNTNQVSLPRRPAVVRSALRAMRPDAAARNARNARVAVWTFIGIGVVLLVVGSLLHAAEPGRESGIPAVLILIGLLGLAFGVGAIPGAVAYGKRMPNATGISAMGILGMILPIIWLVALILALAGSPAPRTSTAAARRPCFRCGESIPVAARVCRFCGAPLSTVR